MLKYILLLLLFTACANKKEAIVDSIILYQDSLRIAKAELSLVDAVNSSMPTSTYEQISAKQKSGLQKRIPIKVRMWTYQWKIDSLNAELKRY